MLSLFSSLGAWKKENRIFFYCKSHLSCLTVVQLTVYDWCRLDNVPICFRRSRRMMGWDGMGWGELLASLVSIPGVDIGGGDDDDDAMGGRMRLQRRRKRCGGNVP